MREWLLRLLNKMREKVNNDTVSEKEWKELLEEIEKYMQ